MYIVLILVRYLKIEHENISDGRAKGHKKYVRDLQYIFCSLRFFRIYFDSDLFKLVH